MNPRLASEAGFFLLWGNGGIISIHADYAGWTVGFTLAALGAGLVVYDKIKHFGLLVVGV